jgi:SAM-dependent methyltransferase
VTGRTREEIHHHYTVEKELAARLRSAGRDERKRLYSTLYDELFERVPDHPQLKGRDDREKRRRFIDIEMSLLERYLHHGTTFMEIGCGDCSLSYEAAKRVGKVYGVDVSSVIAAGDPVPGNFELVISDGVTIDVPPSSVDIAYSRQLLEHLHPDDAVEHVERVHRALKKGGLYICITPHRHSGPHDISKFFERRASGLHFHEYTHAEIVSLFREAGFGRIRPCKRMGLRYLVIPYLPLYLLERMLEPAPYRIRKRAAEFLFGTIRMIAEK